jgi:hypothetical protein
MRRQTIAALGIAVAAVLALSACASTASNASSQAAVQPSFTPVSQTFDTSTPTPSSAGPDMLSAGQTETLQDTISGATIGALTVESAHVTTLSADGSPNAPVNGYYVVVHVKAAADSSYTSGWYVSKSDFYDLVNGQHYDNGNGNAFAALASGQANSLSTLLAAGETTDGWLSFDVPSRHGEIVYAPNSNLQPIAEWSY